MARPALPADQRKNVKIEVYVTPPWFEAVTASAAKAKTDVSNYIRSCVERIQAKEAKKEQKAPPAAKPKKAKSDYPPTVARVANRKARSAAGKKVAA